MRGPRNRVVQVTRFGGPEGLDVVDAPLPIAGRGEVRVRVLASSLEYTDVTIRRHLYPWVFRRPPFVLGYNVVAEIDQLGDGVSGLQLGDRVVDMTVQIVVADVSMSLDNVLAVGGAAREHPVVLIFGLGLSIALMGIAASFIARPLQKHRWIAYVGLAVILYVAFEMIYRGAQELRPVVQVITSLQ